MSDHTARRIAFLTDLGTQLFDLSFVVGREGKDGPDIKGPVLSGFVKFFDTKPASNVSHVCVVFLDLEGKIKELGLTFNALADTKLQLRTTVHPDFSDFYLAKLEAGRGANDLPFSATFQKVPVGTVVLGIKLYMRPAISPSRID